MVTIVVAGFALVALPLLVAVVGGAMYVDRLAARGEELVRDSVALAREGQALQGRLAQMERNARQYRILGDASLVELYRERHAAFIESLAALDRGSLALEAAIKRRRLRRIAADVEAVMGDAGPDSARMARALERFGPMRALADAVTRATDRAVRDELAALEATSARARAFLLWQVAALVPVTLALVGVLSWLILRPIRHLARAIRSLGAIEPAQPIVVGGPPEIRGLGEELERLRLRLERSEAEKARFLRHMSHELKTPLAAIREGTELLADGSVTADSDDYREIVEILQRSSVELQQLIENLLVLSARDRAHALERIDLAEVLREALQRHEVTRLRRGLVVDWRVEAVSFDGLRPLVQSALSNLIGNAVHFSPTGGTLHLRGFGRGDRVVVEVADDGPGIPADDRPHVFEPFAQGRHAGTASTRGTGIGLSVVRDCARAHDGYVEIADGGFAGAHIRMVLYARPASATQEGA